MSDQDEVERAGLLFRVSQLHYMIVDRNIELIDVHYPKANGNAITEFHKWIKDHDLLYTNRLRSQERDYFNAIKLLTTDKLREHVLKLEDCIKNLDGILPDGKSGYINFQSVERISTYHVDLYFNGNTLRMVFEIETISNLAGNLSVMHRIERTFPASSTVENLVSGVDPPKPFNGYYYYPVRFPQGKWNLKPTGYSKDRYVQSKIPTDAWINVMTYKYVLTESLDEITNEVIQAGKWQEEKIIEDVGYLIHGGGSTRTNGYNPYDNNRYEDRTLGCIRMNNDDVREIVPFVDAALVSGGRSFLHVAY